MLEKRRTGEDEERQKAGEGEPVAVRARAAVAVLFLTVGGARVQDEEDVHCKGCASRQCVDLMSEMLTLSASADSPSAGASFFPPRSRPAFAPSPSRES